MKYCEFCKCNTSDELKYCPNCGRELKEEKPQSDAQLKEMYDKLMAQKLTLSAMFVSQAGKVENGEKKMEEESVKTDLIEPSPEIKTEVKEGKNYSKGYDDFSAARAIKDDGAGKVYRPIVLAILSLLLLAATVFSFTFSRTDNFKGYEGIVYSFKKIFGLNIGMDTGYDGFVIDKKGFAKLAFDSTFYLYLIYAVSAVAAAISCAFTYKYKAATKIFCTVFLGINLASSVLTALANLWALGGDTVGIGIIAAVVLGIFDVAFLHIIYRKKYIKEYESKQV